MDGRHLDLNRAPALDSQFADQIIVMHKGEVREVRTHEELLRRRGLYWRRYPLNQSDGG